jgi:hypothetical protein
MHSARDHTDGDGACLDMDDLQTLSPESNCSTLTGSVHRQDSSVERAGLLFVDRRNAPRRTNPAAHMESWRTVAGQYWEDRLNTNM